MTKDPKSPNVVVQHLLDFSLKGNRVRIARGGRAHEVLCLLSDPDHEVRLAAIERCLKTPLMSSLMVAMGVTPWGGLEPQVELDSQQAASTLREMLEDPGALDGTVDLISRHKDCATWLPPTLRRWGYLAGSAARAFHQGFLSGLRQTSEG